MRVTRPRTRLSAVEDVKKRNAMIDPGSRGRGIFTEENEGNEGRNEGGNSGFGLLGERVVFVRDRVGFADF